MSETPAAPPPAGRDEATSVDVGAPAHEAEDDRTQQDQAPPNLDEREDRISTRRKPPGPPLNESDEADQAREDDAAGRDRGAAVRPVDPA